MLFLFLVCLRQIRKLAVDISGIILEANLLNFLINRSIYRKEYKHVIPGGLEGCVYYRLVELFFQGMYLSVGASCQPFSHWNNVWKNFFSSFVLLGK